MGNTVLPSVKPLPAVQPGHRLAPAAFGKPGRQVAAFVADPDWCTLDHVENWNQHAEDLSHWGDDTRWDTDCINQPGEGVLSLDMRLCSDPCATDPRLKAAHVALDDESVTAYLTPEMAERAADEMIAFAARMRHLARQAREFNDRAASSPRRARADKWQSLSADDITALPIVRLLSAFGVMVLEYDIDGVELYGEPGHMELRVGREVRQQLRDSEARRLIAEYAAGVREGGVR
jgi:hypothetical protein